VPIATAAPNPAQTASAGRATGSPLDAAYPAVAAAPLPIKAGAAGPAGAPYRRIVRQQNRPDGLRLRSRALLALLRGTRMVENVVDLRRHNSVF
jgi:hypothetical protein